MSILSRFSRSTTQRLAAVSGPVIARYRFTFGRDRCQISAELNEGCDRNTILVISYLTFLFRYFNICDRNQIEPVSSYLLENTGEAPDALPNGLSAHCQKLHALLMATYETSKRRAASEVFKGCPPGFKGYCAEPISEDQKKYSNLPGQMEPYELAVTSKGIPLFDMGNGPHLAMLPQTALLFYAYIVEHLQDADCRRANWSTTPKQWLDGLIRAQIASHEQLDPTAPNTMVNGVRSLVTSLAWVGSGSLAVASDGSVVADPSAVLDEVAAKIPTSSLTDTGGGDGSGAAQKCPACGLFNPGSATRCDCGYDFGGRFGQSDARALSLANRAAGFKKILTGALWAFIGTLIFVSEAFAGAKPNALTLYLTFGPIVYGGIQVFRGIAQRWPRD